MEFKFNFLANEDAENKENAVNLEEERPAKVTSDFRSFQRFQVEDIKEKWKIQDQSNLYEIQEISLPSTIGLVRIVTPCEAKKDVGLRDEIGENDVVRDTTQSDLVSSVYEGGFKVWECTLDMINYLEKNLNALDFHQKPVLDLGCGVGLLGIYLMLKHEVKQIDFQDYNYEVIIKSTGPSVLINNCYGKTKCRKSENKEDNLSPEGFTGIQEILEEAMSEDSVMSQDFVVNFLAGDWDSLSEGMSKGTYDIILSCETIYNPLYYDKLHRFLERHLSKKGTVYFGTKAHYFGVGGGVQSWCDFVSDAGVFEIETVETIETNLERVILTMKFKDD